MGTVSHPRVEAPAIAPPPPKHSALMTMRHDTPELHPSAGFWEKFAANSPPILDQSAGGVKERLGNQRWIDNASPDELEAEREKLLAMREDADAAELKPDGAGTKSEHKTFKIKFAGDGSVKRIDDKRNWQWVKIHGIPIAATFDVSDMMMRQHGIDPYASYKLKVLDETRDQRVELGKRYRTQQLAQSRQLMQKNIERLVATARDADALKQGLFELWDDCAEDGPDDELLVAARAAREQVLGYIRAHVKLTEEELARFNKQRKSRAIFTPYE
jgi:hypothetical protein